ncbi:hypothetical protein DLJ49_00335 [Rhodovulum sp. 12E13]|uniref:hypothetical protein n=1 Tax=Rhodovulum sp. 12E13 TaxID=2203891 RepID=UPI000E1B3EFF|nr:hypothetical protein [Rhodovulum sp. 12E13]RDC75240.1 hypothetical protein DLJ49_00335 [Rhodovulum sp. 12E13]
MTRALTLTLPGALLAAALPAAALAQAGAGAGTVTGTLDLDDARWIVAGADGDPSSTWREEDGRWDIRLVATPEAGGVSGPGTLTIEFTAEAGATEADVTEARVTMEAGSRDYIAEDENVDLSLTAVEAEGSDMVIAGSFQATMTPGGATGLVIETQAGRVVDGNFQATVPAASGGSGGDEAD